MVALNRRQNKVDVTQPLSHRFGDEDLGGFPAVLPPSALPATDDQVRPLSFFAPSLHSIVLLCDLIPTACIVLYQMRAAYATQAVVVDRCVEVRFLHPRPIPHRPIPHKFSPRFPAHSRSNLAQAFVAPILVCTAVGFWDVLPGFELGLDACAGLFSAIISLLEAFSLRPVRFYVDFRLFSDSFSTVFSTDFGPFSRTHSGSPTPTSSAKAGRAKDVQATVATVPAARA